MNKTQKKIGLILLGILILLNMVFANTKLEELKTDRENIGKQLDEKSQEITGLQSQIQEVNQEIKKLDNQIDQSQMELNSIQTDINVLEDEIEKNIINLDKAKLSLVETEEDLNNRLREQYMTSDLLYLEVIFGSKSISEMITKIDILKTLNEQDQSMIDFTDKQIVFIEETEKELVIQQESLKDKLESEKLKKSQLENANKEKLSFMAKLEENKSLAEAEYDDFVKLTESLDQEIIRLEKELEEKRKAEEARRAQEKAAREARLSGGNGSFSWPVNGYYNISSYYGYRIHPIFKTRKFHAGIDIPAPSGTPIQAAGPGIVIYSGWQGGYGNTIMISHGDGLVTLYGHNSSLKARVGDYVNTGDTVSYCGNTGYSTGPHLHFEVRVDGATRDPLNWL